MANIVIKILFPLNFLMRLSENKRQGGDERMTNSRSFWHFNACHHSKAIDRSWHVCQLGGSHKMFANWYHHGALGPNTVGCWVGHLFVTKEIQE